MDEAVRLVIFVSFCIYLICFITLYLRAVGKMLVMFVAICFVFLFCLIILYLRAVNTLLTFWINDFAAEEKEPFEAMAKADKKRYSEQISDYKNSQLTDARYWINGNPQ